jgi:hypothetical protein
MWTGIAVPYFSSDILHECDEIYPGRRERFGKTRSDII